jgi:hypothetical protein
VIKDSRRYDEITKLHVAVGPAAPGTPSQFHKCLCAKSPRPSETGSGSMSKASLNLVS